jgi:proline iminopeptidase
VRTLYPPIQPYDTFTLETGDGHSLYVEQVGDPRGAPMLFLHGGPGGGLDPIHRRFFDPARHRVVLFDQRGAGRSRPHAGLSNNTTAHLVDDIERIRVRLGIERWNVFGGSWGSTLALVYALAHTSRVRSLLLRGVFLARKSELRWFYQEGASFIFPDAWERFLAPIAVDERHDMIAAYHRLLTGNDLEKRLVAARAWSAWEGNTSRLIVDQGLVDRCMHEPFAVALATIECHYFMHGAFLPSDNFILDEVHRLIGIPTVIVQGRYDVVCPPVSAWDLKRALPHAEFRLIGDAGHASSEPGITAALVDATDRFASLR